MNTNQQQDPKTIKARIFSAASSIDRVTGAATLYKVYDSPVHDSEGEWMHRDITLNAPYANNTAILRGFVDTIRGIISEVRKVDPTVRLEVDCRTFVDAILRGYNVNKPVWEANGFITSRGNRVKDKAIWKELFILAQQHKITIRKPKVGSPVMKACNNRCKMIAKEGNR